MASLASSSTTSASSSAAAAAASLLQQLYPHEQYPRRREAYKVASAIARKQRRTKLNDHRRHHHHHHALVLCHHHHHQKIKKKKPIRIGGLPIQRVASTTTATTLPTTKRPNAAAVADMNNNNNNNNSSSCSHKNHQTTKSRMILPIVQKKEEKEEERSDHHSATTSTTSELCTSTSTRTTIWTSPPPHQQRWYHQQHCHLQLQETTTTILSRSNNNNNNNTNHDTNDDDDDDTATSPVIRVYNLTRSIKEREEKEESLETKKIGPTTKHKATVDQKDHHPPQLPPPQPSCDDSSWTDDNHNNNSSCKQKKKNRSIIRPDLKGIRTAVALIRKGHAFAIPTECTYEMILRASVVDLAKQQPPPPPQHLSPKEQQQQPPHKSSTASTNHLNDFMDMNTPETIPTTTTMTTTTTTTNNNNNNNSATPTTTKQQQRQLPHIYISPDVNNSLETSRFWNKRCYIPTRSYGIVQNKQDGGKTIIDRFNEAVIVLKAISPCIWPGPCCVYFPIASPLVVVLDESTDPIPASFCHHHHHSITGTAGANQQQHYVKFRSPRHPLAIRMCHELGYTQLLRQPTTRASLTTMLHGDGDGTSTMDKNNKEENDDDDEEEKEEKKRVNNKNSRTKSNDSTNVGSRCNSLKSCSSTMSSSGLDNHRCVLLIGYPLLKNETNRKITDTQGGSDLVTRSTDVPSFLHALDGEDETYELLRVPTCRENSVSDHCWMVLDVPCRTIFIGPAMASKPQLVNALLHTVHTSSCSFLFPVQSAVLRKWRVQCRDKPFLAE